MYKLPNSNISTDKVSANKKIKKLLQLCLNPLTRFFYLEEDLIKPVEHKNTKEHEV